MPRRAEDLASSACPLCGGDALAKPVPAVAAPKSSAPVGAACPAADRSLPRWLLFALAGLAPVAVGVAIYLVWPKPKVEPVAEVQAALSPSEVLPFIEVAPRPRRVMPTPVVVAEPEVAPPPRLIIAPAVEPEAIADGVIALNNPNGEYVLPDTDGAEPIILTGEIGTLRLGRVFGRANVDASKLRAKVIIVGDRVDGEATLRLRATERVEIRKRIHGAATLTVTAPGGTVRFATAAQIDGEAKVHVTAAAIEVGGVVDGGCRLTVEANEVVFRGEKLDGGARVTVTAKTVDIRCLMAGGASVAVAGANRIRHKDLEAGARLTYSRASPSDPKPHVEGGELRGGATVSEVK